MSVRDADALLETLPSWTIVAGKGGVGKTTTSAALADLVASRANARVLLLSTDPARTLGTVVGVKLNVEPQAVPGRAGLYAAQLDAEQAREVFLARWRSVLVMLVDRGTYLDVEDAEKLVDATLPGGDESFAVLRLAELASEAQWTHVILDTAPTGHTLRLLALPETMKALVRLLDAFQEKHRALVRALRRSYRADEADRFIVGMREQVESLETLLRDGARCAAVVVARPEALVVAESVRLCRKLTEMRVRIGAVVFNASSSSSEELAKPLREEAGTVPWLVVPKMDVPPSSLDGVRDWLKLARLNRVGGKAPPKAGHPTPDTRRRPPDAGRRPPAAGRRLPAAGYRPPHAGNLAPLRPLTIVGGKGGVGKTSVSCAIAIACADAGHPTLVVSTDPAPSVADALQLEIGDDELPVAGTANLFARQLDAVASFDRFRREYGDRVGDAVRAIAPSAGRGSADALDDLLSLAPPGIDELYALASLGDAITDERYARVIVDPAPTGHLLRMLELPPVALHWTHELMRMLLKYREVASIGDAAEGLLDFARRTKAVQAMLHDEARATVLVVALDEPVVRDETARLVDAVRRLEIAVGAVAWNRARIETPPAALAVLPPVEQYQLPEMDIPPRGVTALRNWMEGWRPLS